MTTIDKLNDHEHVSADDIQATAEWLEGDTGQGEDEKEPVDSPDNQDLADAE